MPEKLTWLERRFAEGEERPVWIHIEDAVAIKTLEVAKDCIKFVRDQAEGGVNTWDWELWRDECVALARRIEEQSA